MHLNTQKSLRTATRLPFCYLCGKAFLQADTPNRDHVPPRALFADNDKTCPLILPTHPQCNGDRSNEDEVIGQLVAVLHGKQPGSGRLSRTLSFVKVHGSATPLVSMRNVPLGPIIWRWIRGFHAALYAECVASDTGGCILPPLPEGRLCGRRVVIKSSDKDRAIWVELIKANRKLGTTDRVECWGGTCLYECTWIESDDGQPICVFGLRIYNWEALGDARFPPGGCVGYYGPIPVPTNASKGTRIDISITNLHPLDPFAD